MPIVNFRNLSTSGLDEDALVTNVAGEQVFNFGRLTTTGDLADGIYAQANNVSIRNFASRDEWRWRRRDSRRRRERAH